MSFFAAGILIGNFYTVPYSNCSGIIQVAMFGCAIYVVFYLARCSMLIFQLLKKLVTLVIDKLKDAGDKIKSKTDLYDKILKNLVSIAGTLFVIFNFLEPMIRKILGS